MSGLDKFDLSSQDESCSKNKKQPSHHGNFYSVEDFSERWRPGELPQEVKEEMADLSIDLSRFLVKIAVVKEHEITYGSGQIEDILENDGEVSTLVIRTAHHVVKDLTERTVVYIWLHFDSLESEVIEIKGIQSVESDKDNDLCTFHCTLPSKEVKISIKDLESCKKRLNRYKMERDKNKMVALLSHPHGCCKYISIGHCLEKDASVSYNNAIRYSLASCPGSSGGLAVRFGCVDFYVHSGWDGLEGEGRISSVLR